VVKEFYTDEGFEILKERANNIIRVSNGNEDYWVYIANEESMYLLVIFKSPVAEVNALLRQKPF